ncbi:hypothetical protein GQ43DRAFT_425351 [Delitschia confertaspora ATCC 74209]|uniref:Small ribosomal subunit protein mS41 n=1 Tax=Delitschia confertaspora ATCC 74209 TaxID=1513339 RepID=A0A9P4MNJ8_9PLEO|nr:hypothetical protein GQ43DRAFT_425351 [Delitschia confertaspora ATCC 74209]
MILRRPLLSTSTLPPISLPTTCIRPLHHRIPVRPIPQPTPFIPDANTFLTAIGRGLSAHAAKIPSWDALFTLSSAQLKDLGIEPARSRRYLLHWREKFRNGEYGIGGDCTHVSDGVAELRLVEAPAAGSRRTAVATATHTPGTRRVVVNVPVGTTEVPKRGLESASGVQGVVVKGSKTIKGPFVEAVKGSAGLAARIRMQEGLWEVKRGHKVDGGERRKAEVRSKRRAQENKDARR